MSAAVFQVRRETLMNRNQNADLAYYGLNTSSAQGRQTVTAGFFEIDAPFARSFDLNVSGRYDHYSQGYSHFSPKVVPSSPRSANSRCAPPTRRASARRLSPNTTRPAAIPASRRSTRPPASSRRTRQSGLYDLVQHRQRAQGNPDILPEVSRSFTVGTIVNPARWLNVTVDYYNIRKSNLIVSGPLRAEAINAYYGQTNATDGCAALAKVGPGYKCNVIDAPDPVNPNALPPACWCLTCPTSTPTIWSARASTCRPMRTSSSTMA